MSSPQVCAGATLQCSSGGAPAVLNVLPANRTMVGGVPAATLADSFPIVNITLGGLDGFARVEPLPLRQPAIRMKALQHAW